MRKTTLLFVDIALLYGSLLMMLALRYQGNIAENYPIHFLPFTIIFVIWLIIFYIVNLTTLGLCVILFSSTRVSLKRSSRPRSYQPAFST